jgi:hypothetical protein
MSVNFFRVRSDFGELALPSAADAGVSCCHSVEYYVEN